MGHIGPLSLRALRTQNGVCRVSRLGIVLQGILKGAPYEDP